MEHPIETFMLSFDESALGQYRAVQPGLTDMSQFQFPLTPGEFDARFGARQQITYGGRGYRTTQPVIPQPRGPQMPSIPQEFEMMNTLRDWAKWMTAAGKQVLYPLATTWSSKWDYLAQTFVDWWNTNVAGKPVYGQGGSITYGGIGLCPGQPWCCSSGCSKALANSLQFWAQAKNQMLV